MAKPRAFVSSTYYDLKHIRSSLDLFIDTLGYESILSEKGDIAYSPDIPLDESCYREVENVDILILVIGGRYGSESSIDEKRENKTFFDRYESITKKEYETALSNDISSYILIESNVYAEYQTFLRNKSNRTINYAHVDSINIFHFIEEILSKPRNNPLFTFEKFAQIEEWLRTQWSGLFRELLKRKSQQSQIKSLTSEILELQEVNKTLKTYMEALMSGVTKNESNVIIKNEEKRLKESTIKKNVSENPFYDFLNKSFPCSTEQIIDIVSKATDLTDFKNLISEKLGDEPGKHGIISVIDTSTGARNDINKLREILGLKPFAYRRIIKFKQP